MTVPEADRQIRYLEYAPHHLGVPPGKSGDYTMVEIVMFHGRSIEAKRKLYAGIVRELGVAPADLFIVLREPPLENWGMRGVPASELELGFKLEV